VYFQFSSFLDGKPFSLKIFKKPKTYSGLIISEITSPTPKIIPQSSDTILFIIFL